MKEGPEDEEKKKIGSLWEQKIQCEREEELLEIAAG